MDNVLNSLAENITCTAYADIKKIIQEMRPEDYTSESAQRLISIMQSDSRINVQKLSQTILRVIDRHEKEIKRVKALYDFDSSFGSYRYIAGVDEVGRGPLAGPIVSAAVILDLNNAQEHSLILGINDSKKLSRKQREELAVQIKEKALCISISSADNNEIDSKGIAFCNNNVFKEACNSLALRPDMVLSDGYAIKGFNIENRFAVKGDSKSASIACASIIAKVYRDLLMDEYAKVYPQYGFDKNAGYGTKEHIEAIRNYGITPIHRRSFLKGILEGYR